MTMWAVPLACPPNTGRPCRWNGTSLGVYPAAGLIDYYRGHKLVLINKSETPYDNRADLLIHDALGEVFSKIG